jgi:GTPase SAR1 family protein
MEYEGIILSGKQGAGKTSVAESLVELIEEETSERVEIIPFAKALKDAVGRTIDEFREVGLINTDELPKSLKRPAYQAIGQGLRDHYPGIWVDTWLYKAQNTDALVVNDDARYPNEIRKTSNNEFFTVRLKASRGLRAQRIDLIGEDHDSEVALDDFDEDEYDLVIDQDQLVRLDGVESTPGAIAQDIWDVIKFEERTQTAV